MFKQSLVLFLGVLSVSALRESPPTAKTSSGTLKGKRITVLEKPVKLFLGVPYSLPPIASLRFKAPVALSNEDAVWDAQDFRPICYQPPHFKSVINPLLKVDQVPMSEDCLYLNLYVPEKNAEDELPVMVWLTGEGFSYADPTQFDGSFLASSQNVIVVTVSYRVSVFGFFNGLSEEAPGNVGLLDQRLALKWVQENIRAFGGNPDKVTLSGRLSGAMSAVIHATSPLNKDESLFQRVILHSGIPDGKWVFNTMPLNDAMLLAENMGCVFGNFSDTISCLKRLPAEILLNAGNSLFDAWRPSLDFKLINVIRLSELLKGNNFDVDVMIGTNNNEGSLCLAELKVVNYTLYEELVANKLSKTYYERLMASHISRIYKESNQLVNDLTSFAYRAQDRFNMRDKFVEFCGDLYINALSGKLEDILRGSRRQIYVYELSHRPSFSIQPSFVEAGHGDDVLYSFGLPLQMERLPQQEVQLTHVILKAIGNFVHYGNPNGAVEKLWPAYNEAKLVRKFDVVPQAPDVIRSSHGNMVHFWQVVVPSILENHCNTAPVSAALLSTENASTDNGTTQVEKGMNLLQAKYIMVALFCSCLVLTVSLILALMVIFRQSSLVAFQRLK